ncbi:MAG: DUF4838 domain-containing protein [Phycisphaeraceae bacterium]|nr:DUF4838 domain-containing protein [Phycisphaeraceae bacterium]
MTISHSLRDRLAVLFSILIPMLALAIGCQQGASMESAAVAAESPSAKPAPAGPAVTIIRDGQSLAVIVMPDRVGAPDDPHLKSQELIEPGREKEVQRIRLRESLEDLAQTLEKMSGAKVEVVAESARPAGDTRLAILAGESAEKEFGKSGESAPYKQGFRLVVSPKGIGFIGESDLATSYAVYELLDRLGCRWYMPGDLGEVIPTAKTVKIASTDFSSAPFTIYRSIWYADEPYRRRNRMGGLLLNAGHALENSWITKEDRKAHPEWQGTVNGKPRGHRLKWSSQSLADAIADKILAAYAQNPQPSYSLSPDDGMGFDNSPEDRALDAGDMDPGFGEISITDRLMVLANRIAERVSKQQPDLLLGILAYVNYTRPPVRESVNPMIVPQIAPITYARAHPMDDPNVPGNKELRYLVEGWAKKARMTSYYFYGWFLAEPVAPNPMLTKWGHDVPYVLEKGNCRFWQPETTSNFETSMHALYMANRLAFDAKLKPADIYREINEKLYGHAALEMAAYWQFIDDAWTNVPEYSGCGFGYLRRWTRETMAGARQRMNAAIAAAKTDMEKRRVALADDSLKLFESFMQMRYDQAEGRFANLATQAEEWTRQAVALGQKYQENYAFTKVSWTPHTMGGAYFKSFYELTYIDASRIARDFKILTTPPLRQWKYLADPEKQGEAAGYAGKNFDDKAWKTTDVAVETWSTLGYHDYFKSMWYRASVSVKPVAGKKTYLWLGATDGAAKVFVNGKHVPYVSPASDKKPEATLDEADGYCNPFSFDITSALDAGGQNTIAIFCTRKFFNELGTGGLIAPVVVYQEK